MTQVTIHEAKPISRSCSNTGDQIDGDFVQGVPIFAVAVRSKNNYGPQSESLDAIY